MNERHDAFSRREFVKGGSVLLGGLAASAAGAVPAVGADGPPAAEKVPSVILGRTGVRVSRLGIGCAYFQRKPVTPDDVRATLHRALELGVNYLDTAPVYGDAEEKMGPAIAEIRDKVFLVTKTEEPTYDGTWKLLRQSLKRMRTDRVDLVHLHNFGDENMWGDRKLVFGDHGAVAAAPAGPAAERGPVHRRQRTPPPDPLPRGPRQRRDQARP